MQPRKPFHLPWRLTALCIALFSLCMSGIAPADAVTIRQTPIPITPITSFDDGSYPAGLVYGPDQSTWFMLSASGAIGWINGLSADTFALPDPASVPLDITIGPDQTLWFTEKNSNKIGRLIPGGDLEEFALEAAGRSPTGIALGHDETIWFTEFDGNRIGRITLDGTISEFSLPTPNSKPHSIISDPRGDFWFTEWGGYRIGKITLEGEITEYTIPTPPARPLEILYGPDQNLWIVFNAGKTIGRFDPQNETFALFPLVTASASLTDLTIGPDGRIWFLGTHSVGFFELVNGAPANLQENLLANPVYTYDGRSQIITGPDNNLIFTAANSSAINQVMLDGAPLLRDLQLFITYQPPLLLAAGEFYIDTLVVNYTHAEALNVEFDLTLDENIHFVRTDLPDGDCTDNGLTVHCVLPALGAGEALPVRFVMTTDRIHVESVNRSFAFEVTPSEGDYQPANNRVILHKELRRWIEYFNDFSQGADDFWSDQKTSKPVAGLDVLGLFDNQEVKFKYPILPSHDRVWLCFDLYVLGPWDGSQYVADDDITVIGPDLWANYIDDQQLLVTTYSNQRLYDQAFPANYPDEKFAFQTKAAALGEYDGYSAIRDAKYHFCYQEVHTNLALDILFMGLNLDELDREKWAIDNVSIKIFYDNLWDRVYIPFLVR